MKAYTFIFFVVNGHHGGYLSTFFEFFKNSNFWVFGGHFYVKNCPKFKISQIGRGFTFGGVYYGFEVSTVITRRCAKNLDEFAF